MCDIRAIPPKKFSIHGNMVQKNLSSPRPCRSSSYTFQQNSFSRPAQKEITTLVKWCCKRESVWTYPLEPSIAIISPPRTSIETSFRITSDLTEPRTLWIKEPASTCSKSRVYDTLEVLLLQNYQYCGRNSVYSLTSPVWKTPHNCRI